MTDIIVENLSPQPRTHWCQVLVPKELINVEWGDHLTFQISHSREWRAVVGRPRGNQVVVYLRAEMDGHETVRGVLVDRATDTSEHSIHPWVADDLTKLVASAGVRINGSDFWTRLVDWRIEVANQAVQRWKVKSMAPNGIIMELWADVWSNDPVIDVYGKIVWSDRLDSSWNRVFDAVWLKSGEALALDYANVHGIVGGAKNEAGEYVYLLGRDIPFCDGAALPFTGSMLCFKDRPDALTEDQVNQSVQNLKAAAGAPIVAIVSADHWEGRWLAGGNLPRVEPFTLMRDDINEWNRFVQMLDIRRGWHASRPLGCTSTPGQTGSQEDFGATKGTLAVVGSSPRHIYRMRYSVQADLFRGCHHYEYGVPLNLANHPNWVTWSQITHYHTGVSTDRLGKEPPRPPANGWWGYDAQHRSQNNLAAYLALHDDPLMADHVVHMVTTDLADFRRRFPNNGPDSARGQGRPVGTWAQLSTVSGPESYSNLLELIRAQTLQSYTALIANNKMALSWIGPDARVPLFVDGVLAPSVSLWEHALAVIGFRLATGPRSQTTSRKELIITRCCEILAQYALHETAPGVFRLATSCHWNGGNEPKAYLWDTNSGVGGWIRAGLMLARDWLGEEHPLHDKIDRYLLQNIEDPSTDVVWAEWYAIVKRRET